MHFPIILVWNLLLLINIRVWFFSEECLIENDPSKYFYVAQGMLTIDNVDDAEEMRLTSEAFDILGFTKVHIHDRKIKTF